MSNLPVYSTLPQLLHFLFFPCQTGYIKQACMFWPWSRQTLISHTLLPPGFLRIALCRFRHMCRWAWLCDCIWIYLWVLSCQYNRTADWHLHLCRICASVLWSGHNVLSHDRWLCRPSTGSLATLFHNLSRNKNLVHELWCAVRILCNGCQLACSGYEHEAKGGSTPT